MHSESDYKGKTTAAPRETIADAFPRLQDMPSDTATNAVLQDTFPHHTETEITATIATLQSLFETLPGVVAATRPQSSIHQPPYTTCGEIRRAVEMLRSYRLAATVVRSARERKASMEAEARVQAAIIETEQRMKENCEQLIAAAKKEARRNARRTRSRRK